MSRIRKAWQLVTWSQVGVSFSSCAACAFPLQIKLNNSEMGVRCLRCGASAVTQSLIDVIHQIQPMLAGLSVYELSAQGALVNFLDREAGDLTTSEFIDPNRLGEHLNDVRNEDVQRLSFTDNHFDCCTSTEVFEHVEDDAAAFREVLRVLKPGGFTAFTVPLHGEHETFERTTWQNGHRIKTAPDELHADRYHGNTIFCYRNYGSDILTRLETAGFISAQIRLPKRSLFGFARRVIVARKPGP